MLGFHLPKKKVNEKMKKAPRRDVYLSGEPFLSNLISYFTVMILCW